MFAMKTVYIVILSKEYFSNKAKQKNCELILHNILATMFSAAYWQTSLVNKSVADLNRLLVLRFREKTSYKEA